MDEKELYSEARKQLESKGADPVPLHRPLPNCTTKTNETNHTHTPAEPTRMKSWVTRLGTRVLEQHLGARKSMEKFNLGVWALVQCHYAQI